MKTPVPVAIVLDEEQYNRAVKRIAELGVCRSGSIEEAEQLALLNAVGVWQQRRATKRRRYGRSHHPDVNEPRPLSGD
jgi:hypothetical protein